jgi:hypothetical protein
VLTPDDYVMVLGVGGVLYKAGLPERAAGKQMMEARQDPDHTTALRRHKLNTQ